jgi:2-aminoethylphosphonate-pyruvate transaminase
LLRYGDNFDTLSAGMAALDFKLFLDPAVQAPATFHCPAENWLRFQRFYRGLAERGFLIYPGKLSHAEGFRIGCIGAIQLADFRPPLIAIREVVGEMKCLPPQEPAGSSP